MPEANVLYSVTAAVVVGLVAWVAVVLKSAKEPWARETPKPVRSSDEIPVEGARDADAGDAAAASEEASSKAPPSSSLPKVLAGSAGGAGADTTAEATAVVVSKKATTEPEAKDAEAKDAEAKDEPGEDDKPAAKSDDAK